MQEGLSTRNSKRLLAAMNNAAPAMSHVAPAMSHVAHVIDADELVV
jgi:hypothetical protein